jgi:hypothetical protein
MTFNNKLLSHKRARAHARRQMLAYKIQCVYVCLGKSPVETGEADAVKFKLNQPTRCNNFSNLLCDVYLQLNIFRAISRPSSGVQQLR